MVRFKPDEHGTLEYSDLHSDLFEGGRDSEKLYLLVRHLVDFASLEGRGSLCAFMAYVWTTHRELH